MESNNLDSKDRDNNVGRSIKDDTNNDFDLDNGYYNDEREIDTSNTRLENNTFDIRGMIVAFENRLRGFNWRSNGDKYVYEGNPLAGDKTIQNIMLLLEPFSKPVTMIGNKNNFEWQKQKLRTRLVMASILTTASDSDVKNAKMIWRTFSNLIVNIGDIILERNSQNMLKGFFRMGDDSDKKREGDLIV